uniref:IQ domain-containing protein IQM2-like n=1 Tax=Erigeron canadensis TaxID=72917 RepID=UPI001CB9A2D4|nr:IQ domain-containing protein IQM2-like [Erigeron canadensis]
MGLSYSCPFTAITELENASRAISLEDNESIASNSAEETELDYTKMKEMCTGFAKFDNVMDEFTQSSIFDLGSPEHEAAIKLQKVYKSFRTRRKLADCAVQIEQSLWKLLDFAELKRSSISFFNVDKQETAFSRWSRARTRAAKVGKGLSKNSKAQKLALQHWLEAIDPRHRYGHNLHFYYGKWLLSQSKEPFFYWLDIGEGKEINLVDKCPRSKLQQQCIKYLGPIERKAYEVVMKDGKLLYKQTGEFLDTTGEPKGSKWIFVLSTSKVLYVGIKKKGSFQHSSFLAGGATLAAGRVVAEKGTLKAIWPHSGHYRPTQENFQDFISFLKENDVDMTYVKMDSDEDKEHISNHIRTHSSEEETTEKEPLKNNDDHLGFQFDGLFKNLSNLEIPKCDDPQTNINTKNQKPESCCKDLTSETILDGYEPAEDSFDPLQNDTPSLNGLSDNEDEPSIDETVSQKTNSQKDTNSFQLGDQLSCKWSTGAGPRISCLRDYPTELQSHALEQANLSPRSAPTSLRFTNTEFCTSPLSYENRSLLRRYNRPYRTQSTPSRIGSLKLECTDFHEQ